MSHELLLQCTDDADLERLGGRLFDLLGVKTREVRYSENTDAGRYLTGSVCGVRVRLDLVSYAEFSDYNFSLTFYPLIHSKELPELNLNGLAHAVAMWLAHEGWLVARKTSPRVGTPLVKYDRPADPK